MDARRYYDSVVMLHFNITNRCVGALVDMDTAVSCCALSFPRRLLPTYKSQMLPTDECFSTADGESFTPVGIITLHFTIGSLTLNEKFYILLQGSSYPDLDSFPYSPNIEVVTISAAQAARETASTGSYKPHLTSGSGADRFKPAQTCSQTPRTQHNAQLSGFRPSNSIARSTDLTSEPCLQAPRTLINGQRSGFRPSNGGTCPADRTPGHAVTAGADSASHDKLTPDKADSTQNTHDHDDDIQFT